MFDSSHNKLGAKGQGDEPLSLPPKKQRERIKIKTTENIQMDKEEVLITSFVIQSCGQSKIYGIDL